MNTIFRKCKLKNLTWLKVGGEADFLHANDLQSLFHGVQIANEKKVKVFTIGAGSNVLATDNDINSLIIKLGSGFNYISLDGSYMNVGCATPDAVLAKFALENEIADFEFLSTIPGTIGGAIAMNAGSYDSTISMHLDSIKVMDQKGIVKTISVTKMGYKYRGNSLDESLIFLEGRFKIKRGLYKEIQDKMDYMVKMKSSSQPLNAKSCGSFFKNPFKHEAWRLIDDAGCRGMKFGGAEISTKHCNFLINAEGSTSNDISMLYKTVQHKVKNCFNVILEPEVVLLD